MAWNKYYIFIKEPKLVDTKEIFAKLNLKGYKPIKEVPLHFTNKPETLFTAFYDNLFLIVHPELPFSFFGENESETEKLFISTFPNSEIAIIVENSTVGLYSYAVIENGRKIRMKDGCDGDVYNDFGDLLPEEKEILKQKIFSDEEVEEMNDEGMTQEEITSLTKHEASLRVPNLLIERYLNEKVHSKDELLLTMYVQ